MDQPRHGARATPCWIDWLRGLVLHRGMNLPKRASSAAAALAIGIFTGSPQAQEQAVLNIALHPAVQVSGEIGATYAIESKTELPGDAWVKRANLKMTQATMIWFDPEPAETGKRFYRAVRLHPETPDMPGMVWIEPGSFPMGSPDSEEGRNILEGPQTQVILTQGFWLGKCEVTQREYAEVMGTNPSYHTGDLDLPVEKVSWNDAVAF